MNPSSDPGDTKVTPSRRLRVLAVVSRFKWQHIDYLHALSERFDLTAVCVDVGHDGAVDRAQYERLHVTALPSQQAPRRLLRRALGEVLDRVRPDVVHVLYYFNEELTLLVRALAPSSLVVHECRDPLTTFGGASFETTRLEGRALRASDGQIFVSGPLRSYLERLHGFELGATSIIVPQGFALNTLGATAPKLSERDGETHLALVGTCSPRAGDSRYYVEIIERLTQIGFVVHSHFHEDAPGANHLYRKLARRNPRYHYYPAIEFRGNSRLSTLISRYDVMGVFHDLTARDSDNEAPTLAVCMPTKAVCGWFHGGIPVICFAHYRGLVELIEEHGIGFVPSDWDELAQLVGRRAVIAHAAERVQRIRERFSNEWNARRIETFFAHLLTGRGRESIQASP